MAITLISSPNSYTASDNPITWEFSSDEYQQPNFSFLIETYLDGTLVSTDRIFLRNTNASVWDASGIIRNLIQVPRLVTSGATIHKDSGSHGHVKINIIEEYGTTVSQHSNLETSEVLAVKMSLSDEDFETVDVETVYKDTKFFSNFPESTRYVLREQVFGLTLLEDQGATLQINFFDSDDNNLQTYLAAKTYVIWQIDLRKSVIESIISGFNFEDIAYFTVQVASSEVIRFEYLDNYCALPYALGWVNNLGGFDSYIFAHNLTRMTDVSDIKYQKPLGKYIGSSFTYDSSDAGVNLTLKMMQDKGKLSTDYLSESIQNWIVELYESISVNLFDVTGKRTNIYVTTGSYVIEQSRFNDLIFEEITYINANNRKSIKG